MLTPTKKIILFSIGSFLAGSILATGFLLFFGFKAFQEPPVITAAENTQNNTTPNDQIHIMSPAAGSTVKNPLIITGEARGTWFFEASFPITLVDESGKTLATGHAEAATDWMKTDFVPFTATLTFTKKNIPQKGTLIFHKDNPSGLSENDAEFRLPIIF